MFWVLALVGVLVNIDRMVGKDFETGLQSFKALAEKPKA